VSIRVSLDDVGAELADRPLVYLVTTDGTQVKVAQVSPRVVGTQVHAVVGPGTLRNVADHPAVTLVAPPPIHDDQSFTLLVDGVVQRVDGSTVVIEAEAAVMHRQAPA
jgi:hypothetical protein